MERLALADLDRQAGDYDRAVAATAGIDGFCSSAAWVVPAATALMGPGTPVVVRDGDAFAAFALRSHEGRQMLEPLELAWGLACPVVGADAAAAAEVAAVAVGAVRSELVVIAGLASGSPLWAALTARLAGHRLGRGPATRRHRASLAGGVDGFLSRRPRELRKALRRARARALAAGVTFEHHAPTDAAAAGALYDRARAIEARSWKGRAGTGLGEPTMDAFYRAMIARLAGSGAARVTIARRADRDLGYVLGARWRSLYRGLQFSFDDDERALSLGNLAQLEVVGALAREGDAVTTYDLGTGGEYKERWCEEVFDTVSLLVARR